MGTFRRHLSVLLWKNSVLKRCSADLSLPSSKQEVTNLNMVFRRDNKIAILHLYPIIRYHIWNGSGTWCCIVHLSLSWIIQSNIRTEPMLLAVWAVSSHCFHCFIGAGKTFDLQPRGSVERSEMWMVWTWTLANWFRIFESNFVFQRSEISKQPTMWRSLCWCVCRRHTGFVGVRLWYDLCGMEHNMSCFFWMKWSS